MISAFDNDLHRSGNALQFAGAGIGDDADVQHKVAAFSHSAIVHQHERAFLAAERSCNLFQCDVRRRTLGLGLSAHHLAFAYRFDIALKFLIEKQSSKWSGSGVVCRLRYRLYVKSAFCCHGFRFCGRSFLRPNCDA